MTPLNIFCNNFFQVENYWKSILRSDIDRRLNNKRDWWCQQRRKVDSEMLYTNTECMQTAGSNVIDRQSVCADQWSSSESNTEVFCRCSASSENTRVRGRMSGRKRIITWFSLAEDSMNAAFHDSAKALPSSQLMTLRETHIYSFKYRLHIKVHTNLHSFHLFYKKRNLSEIKKNHLYRSWTNEWRSSTS